jgi:hypothetical protein
VKRSKTYSYRAKANRPIREVAEDLFKDFGILKYVYIRKDDPGGEGWELEKELIVCPKCAGK